VVVKRSNILILLINNHHKKTTCNNDYKIKNELLKRNFEEGINENYIVIKSLKSFLISYYYYTTGGSESQVFISPIILINTFKIS